MSPGEPRQPVPSGNETASSLHSISTQNALDGPVTGTDVERSKETDTWSEGSEVSGEHHALLVSSILALSPSLLFRCPENLTLATGRRRRRSLGRFFIRSSTTALARHLRPSPTTSEVQEPRKRKGGTSWARGELQERGETGEREEEEHHARRLHLFARQLFGTSC